MGRDNFVREKGLSMEGKTSVRAFIDLTKNAYGGEVIRRLEEAYKEDLK